MMSFLRRLRKPALIVGFGGAALILLTVMLLDYGFGTDVVMIAPNDEATVELNRAMYIPGDPVPELYGNPMSKPVRVVLASQEDLIRPEEQSDLVLLKVDKLQGENPLQVQTVHLFSRFLIPGFLILGVAGWLLKR